MRTQQKPSRHHFNPFLVPGTRIRARTSLSVKSNRESRPQAVTAPSPSVVEALTDDENWELDEHWTAVTGYVAAMDFPNEG